MRQHASGAGAYQEGRWRVAQSGKFWWCLKHKRVETDENRCKAADRLGPYNSAAEAERALQTVAARNEAWDAEDKRWNS